MEDFHYTMFDCQRDPEGMFDYLPDLWSKFGVVCACMCGTPVAPQSFHGFLDSLRNQTICGEKARYVWCFAVQPSFFPIFKWHQSLFWLLRSIYLEKHGSYKAEVARVPTLVEDHGWEARLLTSCRFTGQITTAGNRGGSYLGNGQLIAGERGNSEMVNIHDKQVCWMCGKYFSQSQSMRRGCVVCSCFLPWVRRI